MKHLKVILAISIILLVCCSEKSTRGSKEIIVNPDDDNKIVWSEIAQISSIIPLETKDESTFCGVDKIRKYKDRLIVTDILGTPPLVFNSLGKYLFKIGERGKGPCEYFNFGGICINEDEQVFVLNAVSKTIKYKLSDGNYVSEKPLEYNEQLRPGTLLHDYGDIYYSSRVPTWNNSIAEDDIDLPLILKFKNNKVIDSYFRLPPHMINGAGVGIKNKSYDNSFIFSVGLGDNHIYEIKDEQITPKYNVDFGKYEMSEAENTAVQDCNELKKQTNRMCVINNLFQTEKHIHFSCLGPKSNSRTLVLYNKETGKVQTQTIDDSTPKVYFADKDYFYAVINAKELYNLSTEFLNNSFFHKPLLNLDIENGDNPIIVKFKINDYHQKE